jgi:hypothetical protein
MKTSELTGTVLDWFGVVRDVGWSEIGADLWGAANDGAMSTYALKRFAGLVAAAEREACAKPLEEAAQSLTSAKRTNSVDRHVADVLTRHAAAIRARSQS